MIYEPEREAIRLVAGDALALAARDAKPVLRKAQASAVGAWRAGRLEYDDASLTEVARDLGRNLGRTVRVARSRHGSDLNDALRARAAA